MYKEYNRRDRQLVTTTDWNLFKTKVGVLYLSDDYTLATFYKQMFAGVDSSDQNQVYKIHLLTKQIDAFLECIFNLPTVVLSQVSPCVNYSYAANSYTIYELTTDILRNITILEKAYSQLANPDFLMFLKHIRVLPLKSGDCRLEIHGVHHRLVLEEDFLEAQLIARVDVIDGFLASI